MNRFLVVATLTILVFSSCNPFGRRVRGDGNVTVQNRAVENFKAVQVGGALDVYVSQDSGFSVRVEADENLQEFIEVYNDGNTLRVRQRNNTSLNPSRDIKVYVTAPEFSRFGASGASEIKGQNRITSGNAIIIDLSGASEIEAELRAPSIRVDMSGASTAELSGETRDLDVEGSGSSNIKAMDLLTENASIRVSGASDAKVYASVKLEVKASGASSVRYKGNASVSSNSSGASSIKKVD